MSPNDPECHPDVDDVVDQADAEKAADTYHSFIGAELIVPDAAGNQRMARVLHSVRALDSPEDRPTNIFNDRMTYEVQFPNGKPKSSFYVEPGHINQIMSVESSL